MLARIRERKDQDGFTLIELLVVMIIIGILAAIAIPVFLNQRAKAHDSAIKSDLRTAATEIESDYVNNQTYPATVAGQAIVVLIKKSTGVTLTYVADAGTPSKGYCITGVSDQDGTSTFRWDSDKGGMQKAGVACS